MSISFGTDGWRAVISETFTFANLRLLSQAIADYIRDENPDQDGLHVVVGYDTRFLSDRYGMEVARVMAGNGIRALLANRDCATPVLSHAVKDTGAVAGVMITASHNAPRYNGVKLKASYGGSASNEQSRRVEGHLRTNEERARGPNLIDYEVARQQGLIERYNPVPAYYDHIRRLVNLDIISAADPQVVHDPMYGSGRGAIKGLLGGVGIPVHEIRGEMNPGFGGIHPEPLGKYLGALAAAIQTGQGNIGLATDGDADRIGAMDENGRFIDPHRIFALVLRYLVEERGQSGMVVRTVSTTRMIDRLCRRYGLAVRETPVGFNYIADLMMEQDVLMGGEESGGISIKGHIPEGDGILLGLLLLEVVAKSGKTLGQLVDDLHADVGPAHYARTDLHLRRTVNKAEMTARLRDDAPKQIAGLKVAEVSTTDGVKYIMEDESWLLIRPSGTEPVLRVYAEGRTDEINQGLLGYGEEIAHSV
ncbi:MAG: phosphoglucomutase/phosphomannomutase family protein [Anaerolineae bacterium]|nr:phosphoglucomutase/phosphomannomutase family protein [Anaerolineae bacterium]